MSSKHALCIAMGLSFGAAMWTAFHNVGLGIAFSAGVGIAAGLSIATAFWPPSISRRSFAERPLPDPLGLFRRDESD